jgi:hypothetical protein
VVDGGTNKYAEDNDLQTDVASVDKVDAEDEGPVGGRILYAI